MKNSKRRQNKAKKTKYPTWAERGYVFRKTTDNWYPNYPGDLVRVSPVLELSDGKFRVCVWGADDCGMEKDLTSKMEAKLLLKSLKEIITKADLTKLGFVPA